MTKFVFFLFVCCFTFNLISQDTLNCKTDLKWDNANRFYYKINDPSKQKYTGPAKCFPQKGVENRGTIKNGNWEGVVHGYKGSVYLGYYTFTDGFYNGPTVKYHEETFEGKNCVKDSTVLEMGKKVYEKIYYRTKNLEAIDWIDEVIYKGDSTKKVMYIYEENTLNQIEIKNYFKGKKAGLFINYHAELDENEKQIMVINSKKCYNNGKLEYEFIYDGGYLFGGNFYDKSGNIIKKVSYFGDENKIESEAQCVKGKIVGEVKHFDENGKLIFIEKYENGKLIESTEQ